MITAARRVENGNVINRPDLYLVKSIAVSKPVIVTHVKMTAFLSTPCPTTVVHRQDGAIT